MQQAGPPRPAYLAYHLMWTALDWLYPPTCGGCGCLGERWCPTCQQAVQRISDSICPVCGDQQFQNAVCPQCQSAPPAYQAIRTWGAHRGSLRHAIHRLKYGGDIGLGEALSKHLIEIYNLLKWNIDLITAVPLSAARKQQRGYNQAELLARPLAYAVGKPYHSSLLHRTRDTRSQVGLGIQERKENVADAFTARQNLVTGKAILVIDDVTTTGSTINACAQALSSAGASAVFGLTLARAVLQADVDDLPPPSFT